MKFVEMMRNHKVLWMSTTLCLLAGFTSFQVQGYQGRTIIDPRPLDTIYAIHDEKGPVLTSLAALYTPMETEASWITLVCAGMTESGCNYFKDNQANVIWDEQLGNAGSTAEFKASAATIDETHQVWKVQTTIFTKKPGDKRTKEDSSDAYILVQRGIGERWYLDRVLAGPGIAD